MSRYTAAFYHFLISFVVFIFLAYLVLFEWHPGFFYTIDGGWEGMRIIIGVDLVLGPLLTLVVFKAGKPGLKFDLAAIGTFQAACLVAGMFVVYSERPLFFVYYDQHFYSSSQDTYSRYGQPIPETSIYGSKTPVPVIAKVPEDPLEEASLRELLYQDQLPLWVYPRTYTPLEGEELAGILDEAYAIEHIRERDVNNNLDAWIEKHGGNVDDYAFFPVHSRYRDPFIGIRKSDLSLVDILEVPAPMGGG